MPQASEDHIVEVENSEQRFSTRLARPECALAKLRVGARMIPATIIDESSGGFLLELTRLPARLNSKPVELIDRNGRHPLQVIWHRKTDGRVRIGVQRLPQLLDHRKESYWFIWMLAAIIFGLCVGYLFTQSGHKNVVQRLYQLTQPIVNNTYVQQSSTPTIPEE